MHTFNETGAGVPAFLAKLWRLVEDPETNHLIYWSRDGRSFIIQNQAQFARELLPLNYKHNNMASFIRQLNMYGFHKITSIDNGGLKFDRDEMEFSHPCFKRGCPYLLEHIKRKIATQKTSIDERAGIKPEAVNKVLNEVKVMRGRQDSLDSRFSVMKQENEALWREIASLRQKHMKQQQIVNKLIQFLVTIVQPSRNMSGVKRHFQLMINDAPQSSKVRKRSESDSGPVIRELTEELLDEVADSDAELLISSSPNALSPCDDALNPTEPEMPEEGFNVEQRPHSNQSVSSQHYDSNHSEDTNLSGSALNNPGNDVVYHITELPENLATSGIDAEFFEENALNTPLDKDEMGRRQELYKLRRKQKLTGGNQKKLRSMKQQQQFQQQQQKQKKQAQADAIIAASQIKTENDIDPLMFLEASRDSEENAVDPALVSPNTSSIGGGNQEQQDASKQMFSPGDFITTDIPADLFEESPMMGDINLGSGNYNQNLDKMPTAGSSEASQLITSKDDDTQSKDDDANNLTLAKYNNQKYPSDDDIMREDFNTHLDNVQEDLDNLKDILRGDSYSLDANTLLGEPKQSLKAADMLFSDSDILAPYGLSLTNDGGVSDSNKKGSELMTYQPYFVTDLADILDINNSDSMAKPAENDSSSKSPAPPSSVLNTPYPERD